MADESSGRISPGSEAVPASCPTATAGMPGECADYRAGLFHPAMVCEALLASEGAPMIEPAVRVPVPEITESDSANEHQVCSSEESNVT